MKVTLESVKCLLGTLTCICCRHTYTGTATVKEINDLLLFSDHCCISLLEFLKLSATCETLHLVTKDGRPYFRPAREMSACWSE